MTKFKTVVWSMHYDSVDEIPKPLQDIIRDMAAAEMPRTEIARVFELRLEFVAEILDRPVPEKLN